jgi:serine/threonine protein kinase
MNTELSNKVLYVKSGSYGTVEIRNDNTVMKKFDDKYAGMLLKEVSFLRMLNETVIKVDTNNKESTFVMPYLGIPLYKYCSDNKLHTDLSFIQSAMKQFLIKIMKYHKMGVFHCDLMDKNVLWDSRSETLNIIDFGLSILDISDMTENFYEIYALYYKDPTRRRIDKEIQSNVTQKHNNREPCGEISEFLPVSYQDDIWAFGMYIFRMLLISKDTKNEAQLCSIPEDVDVDWIASKIYIPRLSYIIFKCFANRKDRMPADELLQMMPICSNTQEIEILTSNITNLRSQYTLNYKEIITKFNKEKLESVQFYISRISEWFNAVSSSNWIAKCVSLNMILKYLEIDPFIYTDHPDRLRKQQYVNLIVGMASCLSLEMFGDSGLTKMFHRKFDKHLNVLYNDITKSLYPNYIFFPIYKNYHKDLTTYTTYLLTQK